MFEALNKNYTVVDISEDNCGKCVRVPNEVAEFIDKIKLNNAELRSKTKQLEKINKGLKNELDNIKLAASESTVKENATRSRLN